MDEQINENLKRVYDDVLNEEVPDRFRDLLDKLKSPSTEASGEKDSDEK